jgi:hypothetical protein
LISSPLDVRIDASQEHPMRTTLTLDDTLIAKAKAYTGLK